MAITLTPSAARQIVASVEKFGGIGLRLGVKSVGCSGLAYTFDMANEVGPEDQVFEDDSAKLVVDRKALAYLDGSELDFIRDGFKQLFAVRNPNVEDTCGCGESFSVKATEDAA
jgi:iron-sulfur cluster assembly protein